MKTVCYLSFTAKGVVKATKTRPRLRADQRAVLLKVEIPDAVFASPRIPGVDLVVPESAVLTPLPEPTISVEGAAPPSPTETPE